MNTNAGRREKSTNVFIKAQKEIEMVPKLDSFPWRLS